MSKLSAKPFVFYFFTVNSIMKWKYVYIIIKMGYKRPALRDQRRAEPSTRQVAKNISVLYTMYLFLCFQRSSSVTCCHDHVSLLALRKTAYLWGIDLGHTHKHARLLSVFASWIIKSWFSTFSVWYFIPMRLHVFSAWSWMLLPQLWAMPSSTYRK